VAALREEMLRMSFLEISGPDFRGGYLRGDSEDGDAATVAIVKPIDQVQIPGAATPGAYRQSPGEMRLRSCGESGSLFMPDVDPLSAIAGANRVCDAIERIAGYAVHPTNACIEENVEQQVRDPLPRHTPC
jgi:hypothetical protein